MKQGFRIFSISILFLGVAFSAIAANLSGIVLDAKGKPLVGASIYIHEARMGMPLS